MRHTEFVIELIFFVDPQDKICLAWKNFCSMTIKKNIKIAFHSGMCEHENINMQNFLWN